MPGRVGLLLVAYSLLGVCSVTGSEWAGKGSPILSHQRSRSGHACSRAGTCPTPACMYDARTNWTTTDCRYIKADSALVVRVLLPLRWPSIKHPITGLSVIVSRSNLEPCRVPLEKSTVPVSAASTMSEPIQKAPHQDVLLACQGGVTVPPARILLLGWRYCKTSIYTESLISNRKLTFERRLCRHSCAAADQQQ